jgi:hypothetical protein
MNIKTVIRRKVSYKGTFGFNAILTGLNGTCYIRKSWGGKHLIKYEGDKISIVDCTEKDYINERLYEPTQEDVLAKDWLMLVYDDFLTKEEFWYSEVPYGLEVQFNPFTRECRCSYTNCHDLENSNLNLKQTDLDYPEWINFHFYNPVAEKLRGVYGKPAKNI